MHNWTLAALLTVVGSTVDAVGVLVAGGAPSRTRNLLAQEKKKVARFVPDVPIWLDTLVCQLMEKEPEKRPISGTPRSSRRLGRRE